MTYPDIVASISTRFETHGSFLHSRPHGSGHINDTFITEFDQNGSRLRYIVQRINPHIFTNPEALMDNVLRVTREAHRMLEASQSPDPWRRALRVIPAKNGHPFVVDDEGVYWRCYLFIDGARTYDIIADEQQAYEIAKAFGNFLHLVSGIAQPRLHETILDFHHTRKRFERLKRSTTTNPHSRLAQAQPEWAFIQEREGIVDVLIDLQNGGDIPERITHNDTKLNNVLIDDVTRAGICVVDLDTVMPGLSLYDFGDMVRATTNPMAEDETDLKKVAMQMPMFQAIVRGYLAGTGDVLNEAEKTHLVFSARLITLELAMRFLTDYLEGDVYFKTKYPEHNLHRARTQLTLLQSMEDQEDAMLRVVDRLL